MRRVLALNGASAAAGAGFGLLECGVDGTRLHHASWLAGRDGAGLPDALRRALSALDWPVASLGLVAVVVGPGSFTGLRASLALAHGLALGGGVPVVGVSVGEALAPALRDRAGDGPAWCVSQARRGRVFIERLLPRDGAPPVEAAILVALPDPGGPVLLGGDAQELVAASMPGARASGLVLPDMAAIAQAAIRRLDGVLPPRAAQPLYVDAPEVSRAAGRAA